LREKGFTLIESILIIVILVILGAVAFLALGDMTGTKAPALARRLQSDITYAQRLAMTRHLRYRVYFNAAPAPASGYAVVNDADGDSSWGETGEFAPNPAGGGNLSVALNAGTYSGITISAVGFTGGFVEFSSLGVPFDGAGQLSAAKTVTVAGGSATQTVTVQPQTGRVSSP
jgi:type II secretory pathway pseudopilin PulG